jgi:hypothetical protein
LFATEGFGKAVTVIASLAVVIVLAVNKYPTPAIISMTQADTEELGIKP